VSRRALKATILGCCVLLVAVVVIWLSRRPSADSVTAQGPPPVVVTAAHAEQQSWQAQLDAVGALGAVQGVQVTTEVGGLVSAIYFESGQRVEKGARLVQLSTDADEARLASLRAQAKQARSDLQRQRTLSRQGLVAQAELEQSATTLESLEAQASEQRALIDKKRIEAPFTGQLGIRQIDLGEYLPPGSPIVVLESVTPIHVNFSLPEQHYGRVSPGQQLDVRVPAYPEKTFQGVVTAVSPRVDDNTRNFAVQGRLANESGDLRPGMSIHVSVGLEARDSVIALPATAVSYSPYGSSVYVVQQKGEAQPTVARKFVELAERRGSRIAVEGIAPGTLVVTAGQMKLFDGAPVVIADERQARSVPSTAQR
jgi:membrane fusion protein, multidrug efflux system